MPSLKLIDSIIAAAELKEKPYDLNDTEVPGFQYVINPKGKKTFKLRVQNFERKISVFPVKKCAETRATALI